MKNLREITSEDFKYLEEFLSLEYQGDVEIISISTWFNCYFYLTKKDKTFGILTKSVSHQFKKGEIETIIRDIKINKILN